MRRALIPSALALAIPAAALAQTAAAPAWRGPLPPVVIAQTATAPAWSGALPEPKPVVVVAPTSAAPAWTGALPTAAVAQTVAAAASSGPQQAAAIAQAAAAPVDDVVPPRSAGASVALTQVAAAADTPSSLSGVFRGGEYEVGTRYFWSTGKMLTSLKNTSGSAPVSRLTFSGLQGNSGEVFGRVEFVNGLFAKAMVGAGVSDSGNLKDEDFPPAITPYSATNSSLDNGSLTYATVDVGWDLLARPEWQERVDQTLDVTKAHFGPLVGFSYYHE